MTDDQTTILWLLTIGGAVALAVAWWFRTEAKEKDDNEWAALKAHQRGMRALAGIWLEAHDGGGAMFQEPELRDTRVGGQPAGSHVQVVPQGAPEPGSGRAPDEPPGGPGD